MERSSAKKKNAESPKNGDGNSIAIVICALWRKATAIFFELDTSTLSFTGSRHSIVRRMRLGRLFAGLVRAA